MGVGVGSLASKSLAEMGVPMILDLVIGSTWKSSSNERPPVTEQGVHSNNEIILVRSYIPSLDVWS